MASGFTIKIKNGDKVIKELQSKSDILQKQVSQEIGKSAAFMEREIKLSITGDRSEHESVDTGFFRDTIFGRQVGPMSAVVVSMADYAIFLEYGTSKMSPRFHFRNSVERNKNDIVAHFRAILKMIAGRI